MTIHYPIGAGADQVPLNGMLGDLARMSDEELSAVLSAAFAARTQVNALDSTPGRLLTVGAGGLLTGVILWAGNIDDINAVPKGRVSINRATAGTSGNIPSDYGILSTFGIMGEGAIQEWDERAYGATAVSRKWRRYFYAGAVGPWRQVYDASVIVGTVSQTNKVPTGAIIERGSNSNGEYTRWADGTQICTNVSSVLRTTATQAASGGFYFASESDTFIFPAAFSVAPRVTPHTTGQANYFSWGANNSPSSTTNSGSLIICSGLNGAQGYLAYTAVGRWF